MEASTLRSTSAGRVICAMTDQIRIIKHELSRSKCGSFEVRFSDGRPGVFFYWDDVEVAGRPLRGPS